MDSRRWELVQLLFHEAAELPAADRHAFLAGRCAEDSVLAEEVLALLEQDAVEASVLDRELPRVADQLLNLVDEPLPKESFGPYRVTQKLGEGGMGVVYLGRRADLGSLAAIKILRDAWLSPSRRERFANEQRTLAQLNHPGIARIYDANTLEDGAPWFAMEYVDGEALTGYCEARAITLNGRLQLFREICQAVQYAHEHAVVHRDLKPSNILVRRDGVVKLLDFGIAKQLEEMADPANQTRTGFRAMTPAYAAPEQIRGEPVGLYTDVYALGVILYELLTGKLPFDLSKRTPGEAELLIVNQEPAKPSAVAQRSGSLGKTAWGDLDVLCLTAMHKDPSRRYRSAEALIRDIDHYLHSEPLEARPDSLSYRAGKFVRRNRKPLIATAAAIALINGLVGFFTFRLARARNLAVAEASRAERIEQFMLKLFQGDDESGGAPEDLRVLTLLDRGAKKAQGLAAEPDVQTELFVTLGSIYSTMGKFGESEKLLNAALAKRREVRGPDNAPVAESLIALSELRSSQGRYAESEKLVREGLAMDRRHLPPDHPELAKALQSLGELLNRRGAYAEAISVLQEAQKIQSKPGKESADLVITLGDLANADSYMGHYQESEAANRRVLAIDRQAFGENHPNVAVDLINLAVVDEARERYQAAEDFYRRALQIERKWFGEEHPETADAMTMLGGTLVFEGKYDEAEALGKRALKIEEPIYGKVHPRVALAWNMLGRVALGRGRLDEAEADFNRMIEIDRAVFHDKHFHIAAGFSRLGDVYMAGKQYARADAAYREAIRRYVETLPPDHPNIATNRIRLAQALFEEHRGEDAKQQALEGYQALRKRPEPPPSWIATATKLLSNLNQSPVQRVSDSRDLRDEKK